MLILDCLTDNYKNIYGADSCGPSDCWPADKCFPHDCSPVDDPDSCAPDSCSPECTPAYEGDCAPDYGGDCAPEVDCFPTGDDSDDPW